jgi:hypothetical protein
MVFNYPESQKERVHGPAGYVSYESFRPWLRDEFTFRCVYCLKRESWGQVTGEFELDHFEPQSLAPLLTFDYLNLVYACRRCNSVKLDQQVADPLTLLSSDAVAILPDGVLVGHEDVRRCQAPAFFDISQHARLEIPMDLRDPIAFSPPRPASAASGRGGRGVRGRALT